MSALLRRRDERAGSCKCTDELSFVCEDGQSVDSFVFSEIIILIGRRCIGGTPAQSSNYERHEKWQDRGRVRDIDRLRTWIDDERSLAKF